MAPEVAKGHTYNKSVDIWAVGIIMHLAISGKHPLQTDEDTYDSYKEKLKNDVSFSPDPSLSELA